MSHIEGLPTVYKFAVWGDHPFKQDVVHVGSWSSESAEKALIKAAERLGERDLSGMWDYEAIK